MTEIEVELFPGLARDSSVPVRDGSGETDSSQEPPKPLDLQRELPLFSGHVGPGERPSWDHQEGAPKGSGRLKGAVARDCSRMLSGEGV